jgi:hypothetical protein
MLVRCDGSVEIASSGSTWRWCVASVVARASWADVITSSSTIPFPEVPGYSMTLPGDGDDFAFYWSVETHGDHPSVDAAAGPEGLFDSFALEKNVGTGAPRGGTGYYTNSDSRSVNIAAP